MTDLARLFERMGMPRPVLHRSFKTRPRSHDFNQHITWDDDFAKMTNRELYLAASDLSDHVANRVMEQRYVMDVPTHSESVSFMCNKREWLAVAQSEFPDWKIFEMSHDRGAMIETESAVLVQFESHTSSIKVRIYGTENDIDYVVSRFRQHFDIVDCYIEWIYGSDGSSCEVPLRPDRLPVTEMYPFLGTESLDDYYTRFMNADSNILLLIGPPGTGKTSFIRGLLQHQKTSAIVTYDSEILEKDYVFARFIESASEIMVLEDADTFLKPRKDGNTMMHKFLNVGDGLVTTRRKKMIFSTNLPSTKDIDPALIRPGRCFDIVHFDLLNQTQAESAAQALGVTLGEPKEKWSVADLFNTQKSAINVKQHRVGFI
mgnify:FL=1